MNSTVLRHGDTAWLMTSTALVYMMTPALACFYGGLVENKNFLNQLFLSVVCMAIVPVQWCLFGYSFVFGPGNSAFGSFEYAVQLRAGLVAIYGEDVDDINAYTVPSLTYAAYQSSFAIITPALISGAVVGRMKLIPYMLFIFLWSTFCYDPIARWVFCSRGWLYQLGVLDFAGGLVVHIASGISGLVAALIIGSRVQFDPDVLATGQTNLPYTILGTGLLWVGWMGFNGGSALSADGIAALAIVNTNVAAASSMLIWMILDIVKGKIQRQSAGFISIPGVCSATVVGLVVITPAAGYVQPGYALLMGLVGGLIVYIFLTSKKLFFRVDDTLDVFSCHGLGGFIGTILTGALCQKDVNSNGKNGALYGNPIQLWYQFIGVAVICAYAAVCTAILLLSMHFTIGIRIDRIDQVRGLDNVAHGVLEHELPVRPPSIKKMKQMNTNAATIVPVDQ
ncbi:unnamed protein product [Adineta ricciae]|uniref:Ammonium transporter n=1 Tax=Adineta ricciae TaxID=249248 RepID=A0A816BDM2_ADIRI|nr:unnamed protein product [Adineta ricciae]CAF1607845.1 unnamed protein product [Adineta ricciae]